MPTTFTEGMALYFTLKKRERKKEAILPEADFTKTEAFDPSD